MTYLRGSDVLVFVTTENTASGVSLTGTAPAVDTGSLSFNDAAEFGIGKLGSVTATSSTGSWLKQIEGIDVVTNWADENGTFIGPLNEYDIPIRKKWSISITRKCTDARMGQILECRHGVVGTASLNSGWNEMDADTGYRVYVYFGGMWTVLYHGIVTGDDGYSKQPSSDKSMVEVIKFKGNDYDISCPTGSLSASRAPY